MRALLGCLALASAWTAVHGYYLPGVLPHDYQANEQVLMYVNKITSVKTQIPYRYYSLPGICQPKQVFKTTENLGEIIAGDRIESSDYDLRMGVPAKCTLLCSKELTSEADVELLKSRISDDYTVNWIVDNLPAAIELQAVNQPEKHRLQRGFPLGFEDKGNTYIYNHVTITIDVHAEGEEGSKRIVAFKVAPKSIRHTAPSGRPQCTVEQGDLEAQVVATGQTVHYTYDVVWRDSDTPWTHRWDLYLESVTANSDVHWFSIVNSLMIVVFLTGMIAMILSRTLSRDISRYNDEAAADEPAEETGWKLVHGDVFRAPAGVFGPMMLSIFVGTGVQIMLMLATLMVLAVLGILSPASRGSFLTALLLIFVFLGSPAGYVSARLYKLMNGKMWARNTLFTAIMFPGSVFFVMIFVNTGFWVRHSTGAVPFLSIFAIMGLWLCVSTPLVFLGSYYGFNAEPFSQVCAVNNIPRHIPPQPWWLSQTLAVIVGGVLPFGAIFIEVLFIMSSLWNAQTYYIFGILAVVLLILAVTCAEISMVMTYFQLCAEDYNWWWRSFLTPGSSALYLFAYAVFYFATVLQMDDFVSVVIYFGYMLLLCWAFFLFTGSIGFISSMYFVRTIYGAIKVD